MLTEICQYLKNWFNRKPDGTSYPMYEDTFTISGGEIMTDVLADGQFYRVMGSLFNDGVHRYGDGILTDEVFDGTVWAMGIPPEIVQLDADVSEWMEKYGTITSPSMSPYQSESFGGYSYSKASGASLSGAEAGSWQAVFSERLAPWRKI